MKESLVRASETHHISAVPQVEIDPYYISDECPFVVTFDAEAFAQMLADFGVPEETIGQLKIKLAKTHFLPIIGSVMGSMNNFTGNIILRPDTYWRILTNYRNKAADITFGLEKATTKSFKKLLASQRLGKYLEDAPATPLRKMTFALKLLHKAMIKHNDLVALHEGRHKIDRETEYRPFHIFELITRLLFIQAGGYLVPEILIRIRELIQQETVQASEMFYSIANLYGIIVAIQLAYILSPSEFRANKFMKTMHHKYNFYSLTPKDPTYMGIKR